jgi:succinyl-diaminopimelate desuccinylase
MKTVLDDADVVELTAALVNVPSVSGAEGELTDAVEVTLRHHRHLSVLRTGNVVVARTELGRAERVVLAGHLDTVPVADNVPSYRTGNRLYGCGSSDMKSGVAIQLWLAAVVPEPRHDVTYVFYDCEEVEAERNGLARLAARQPHLLAADLAVLLEPTGGVVEGGCQGTMRVEISVAGRRAHSARSWLGSNAIHEAGKVLDRLRTYQPRRRVIDGLEYREGLNAVGITGGVAGNVIPDGCTLTVNYRFAPDREVAAAEQHIRDVFPGYLVTVVDAAPGALPGLSRPAAAEFVAAVGGAPRAKLGWTDVARFTDLGIPAINFGPGNPELAHTRDEYVDTDLIRTCAATFRDWLTSP